MRLARSFVLVTLALSGCSGDSSQALPTAPQSAPRPPAQASNSAALSGKVVDESGLGIKDAVVHVVGGQRAGESFEVTSCGWWDYGCGFQIKDLIPGVEITLRATAPGYSPKEETVVPWTLSQEVNFGLDRIQ
jgi:hypothetical protein